MVLYVTVLIPIYKDLSTAETTLAASGRGANPIIAEKVRAAPSRRIDEGRLSFHDGCAKCRSFVLDECRLGQPGYNTRSGSPRRQRPYATFAEQKATKRSTEIT